MDNNEITVQNNSFGGIIKLRQDIDNSTYQLFQRLEESPTGEIVYQIEKDNKKVSIELSYSKTPDRKVSRTTADLEILLASLLTQNEYNRVITNITMKDMLEYLNRESSAQNYERLKNDLKVLKTLDRTIVIEEYNDIKDNKPPKRQKIKMQSMVIEELELDSRSPHSNKIVLAETFVERVKNRFFIHLPPKQVFFALSSNAKNVCERLITILRPVGRGNDRKFSLQSLKKTTEDFTTEILGYNYKYNHKRKEAIVSVLNQLNFLVQSYHFEKDKVRRNTYIILNFYKYEEYINNIKTIEGIKYRTTEEDTDLNKTEDKINEINDTVLYYELIQADISESKAFKIIKMNFDCIKNNRDEIEKSYIEIGLTFEDYVREKLSVVNDYVKRKKENHEHVNVEALLIKALQENWQNNHVNEEKKQQAEQVRLQELKFQEKQIEERIEVIRSHYESKIQNKIEKIIESEPEEIEKIIEDLKNNNSLYTYNNSLTPLENYRTKILVRSSINSVMATKYNSIAELYEEMTAKLDLAKKGC